MKTHKGATTVPQSHLHSRISYLYQAATYLAEVYKNDPASQQKEPEINKVQNAKMDDCSGGKQFDIETEETTIDSHD